MADHVTSVCKSGFFQLRQIRAVARVVIDEAKKTLICDFMLSRLRLLQQSAVRKQPTTDQTPAISSECCCETCFSHIMT